MLSQSIGRSAFYIQQLQAARKSHVMDIFGRAAKNGQAPEMDINRAITP